MSDPGFKEEFLSATAVSKGEVQPNFSHSSVCRRTSHGLEIYQEFGLVTESEYGLLTGHLPSELQKVKGGPSLVKIPFGGRLLNSNYFLIDLQGLEPGVVTTLRKVRIYYKCQTELKTAILQMGEQLSKDQAKNVYTHQVAKEMAKRNSQLKPAAGQRPESVPALIKKFENLKAAMAETTAAGFAARAQDGEADEPDDDESDDEKPLAPAPKRTMGFNDDDDDDPKPKKKAKAKATPKATATPAPPANTSQPAATREDLPSFPSVTATSARTQRGGDRQERWEKGSTSTAGRKKDKESAFSHLDADMRAVAEKHCINASTKSTSLEYLQPLKFLLEPSKALTNALNGAGHSLAHLHHLQHETA